MVDRRRALIGSAVGFASVASAGWLFPTPAIAEDSLPTPAQSLGPFYPSTIPADHDHDLTRVGKGEKRAAGDLTHLSGNVFDTRGMAAQSPMPRAAIISERSNRSPIPDARRTSTFG